ncbi:BZ3500_MvSof-1268-A1-R1_Chr1-3g01549 [Microbotryum saponariae]|uniref:BZ3500_MvSof-1268-A1-R1_Chr1-3g01549 protein n=1 Tax=Microbotryum saponariae TaxID=289078 RepID=A0A2X0MNN9_9BASI|nr:BZ3500_MvSof-1268-A1-R1_Chr1-3g01549 [Microbotryum saponariae]SCZ94004.1 BZ3501_MvSof-1269-A2-R1_Chr1-3g01151 [Microbotryum saponariae]
MSEAIRSDKIQVANDGRHAWAMLLMANESERSAPSAIWHRRRIGCWPRATEILQGIMRPNPVIEAGSSSKKRRLSKVITLEDDEDEVVEEEHEDFNM